MRIIRWTMGIAGIVLALSTLLRADEAANARAIVLKAIKAAGGEDVLKKYPALSMKGKGTLYIEGKTISFTSTEISQPPEKDRVEIDAAGKQIVRVVNGNKGWQTEGDMAPQDLGENELAEIRDEMYVDYLAQLTPLLGDGYTLSTVPETKVNDKPAVGVRVAHKGYRGVVLYFDKDSGLLVRMEHRAKSARDHTEFTSETTLGDYRKVNGLQVPFKILSEHDGKPQVEMELQEVKPLEKVDEKLFEKP